MNLIICELVILSIRNITNSLIDIDENDIKTTPVYSHRH